MTTPAITAWSDQVRRQTTATIRQHGCSITYVLGSTPDPSEPGCPCCAAFGEPPAPNRAQRRAAARTAGRRGTLPPSQRPETGPPADATPSPSFAYTVGLYGVGHPELLIFGLNQRDTSQVLNSITHEVMSGNDLTIGEIVDIGGWRQLLVEQVPNPGEILLGANDYYNRPREYPVPAVQLTWADDAGRFPWDVDYALPDWMQPRPGTFRA